MGLCVYMLGFHLVNTNMLWQDFIVINGSKTLIVQGTIIVPNFCGTDKLFIYILLLWHIELKLVNHWICKSVCMHSDKLNIFTVYLAFLSMLILFIPRGCWLPLKCMTPWQMQRCLMCKNSPKHFIDTVIWFSPSKTICFVFFTTNRRRDQGGLIYPSGFDLRSWGILSPPLNGIIHIIFGWNARSLAPSML